MTQLLRTKVKSFVSKLGIQVNEVEYTNYKHLENKKLYFDNEYCLALLQKSIEKKTIFHCYWYGSIGKKHLFSIKSVLVTQQNSEVWLWIDKDTWEINNALILKLSKEAQIKIIKYDGLVEREGTPFERFEAEQFTQSDNLAFRADSFRILTLFKYGGVYFDLDVMFLRDISNFLDREFVYCWEKQPYGNNAIIHLHEKETLSELVKIIEKSNSFQPWIIFNYANKLKNVWVLPSTYFDPLWLFNPDCKSDLSNQTKNYLYPIINWNEFFTKKVEEEISYKDFFKGCYAFHWHNRWNLEVTENSYFDKFDKQFSEKYNWDI